jgi:hypothetical protein
MHDTSSAPSNFGRQQLIWFHHNGDEVAWDSTRGRWISLGFSGDGSFGDALFVSLEELDREWEEFSHA